MARTRPFYWQLTLDALARALAKDLKLLDAVEERLEDPIELTKELTL